MSSSFKNLLLVSIIIITAISVGFFLTSFIKNRKSEPSFITTSNNVEVSSKKESIESTNIVKEFNNALSNKNSFANLVFPTGRKLKMGENENFQPTASGKPESAYFGSVRTENSGKRLLPSFHEGIDIAPLKRNRKGMPEDEIYAITDGKVVYINKIDGNSNYGKYVIISHPTVSGEVFSLYAHLASIDKKIKAGINIRAGDTLGIMGNSASTGIQKQNAHLHLEIGLMLNTSFGRWYASQKLKPYHGNYHGWNFIGIDPLLVYEAFENNPQFDFLKIIKELPAAFEIAIKCSALPDYFKRYPILWTDDKSFSGKAIIISASEAGLPISGRNAQEDEPGNSRWHILKVYPEVLGRNGARLIIQHNGKWILSEDGARWLTILTCD
jgi:murein DD-endopeptidase MepM/ murein hydrolase activator NlpD